MPTWPRLVLSLVILLAPFSAFAQKCWMVGCAGNIGYLYIPDSQIAVLPETHAVTVNAVSYKLDTSGKLLHEYGLPAVGSVITLNSAAVLLKYKGIEDPSVLKETAKWAYDYDAQGHTASLYQYKIDEALGDAMRGGATLQVLGYVGDRAWGYSHLFALVMVKSD
ncbi:hypothetical protein [Paraburkholderia sp. BCC1885]|uniref:hypothetical protein n=1 Tax=Paraburkholderia sp. BCC1885 TaxID=2562669 RepID=UPI00118203DC|nr:hypothetical protein [Paraburkholderia sp. BCC1885]